MRFKVVKNSFQAKCSKMRHYFKNGPLGTPVTVMCKVSSNVTGSNFYFRKVVSWLESCFFAASIFNRKTSVMYFVISFQRKSITMREEKSDIFVFCPCSIQPFDGAILDMALLFNIRKTWSFLYACFSMSKTGKHFEQLANIPKTLTR